MTVPGRPGSTFVTGEALVDVVTHPGQEPVDILGGAPTSIALGLARLGCDIELHCWVGTDERGQVMRSHLEAPGVRLAPGADGAACISMAQAAIGEDHAASYIFDLDWNPPRPILPSGQVPLLARTGSITAILVPGAATVEQVLRETRTTSTIVYDPNAHPQLMDDPRGAREAIERLVGLSDLVKCSDEDIVRLYDRDVDLETMLRSWLDKGVVVVVVTCGKEEVPALSVSGVHLEVPANPSVVVADTVGADGSLMNGLEDALWSEDFVGTDRREVLRAVDVETLERIIRHAVTIMDTTVPRAGTNPPTRDRLP